MKRWKNILVTALMVPGLLAFPGCASLETEDYVIPAEKPSAGSGVVAQNTAYQLEWDDQQHCALLRDRATDYVWSTTPYGAYREGSGSVALNSALTIEYYDLTDLSVQSDKSYIAVEEGNSATETVENGVRITYYFPQAEITVPLTLTLEETGLRATVKAADIVESGKTRLMSVSLLPYLCSAQKTTDRSAYLMIPTGSGARAARRFGRARRRATCASGSTAWPARRSNGTCREAISRCCPPIPTAKARFSPPSFPARPSCWT